jgi:hypothetical protein
MGLCDAKRVGQSLREAVCLVLKVRAVPLLFGAAIRCFHKHDGRPAEAT